MVPIALAPVLGNPVLLAAFGVDTSAPLPQQARHVPSYVPALQWMHAWHRGVALRPAPHDVHALC